MKPMQGSALLLVFMVGSANAETLPLFTVSKDTNKNSVVYEAVIGPDCSFVAHTPLKIYWIMENGTTEPLTLLERTLYPMIYSSVTPTEVTGELRALQQRQISFPLVLSLEKNGDRCIAKASGNGFKKIERVQLSQFRGIAPTKVTVYGKDQNNESHTEDF